MGAVILTVTLWPGLADELRVPSEFATIAGALSAAKSGDQILVAPGVYRERIEIPAGVEVRSVGRDTPGTLGLLRAERTILDGAGGAGERPGVLMSAGAVLDGFTVTGVGAYQEEEWRRHHETRGRLQSYEHIGAPGVAGIAVGETCEVRNNIVHHIGYTGIAVSGAAASPLIVSNVCYRNMGGGIGAMNRSTASIRGNTCFENFYAGIGHENADPVVEFNRCFGNIRAGIGISEGASPVVRSNLCYGNRRAGIGIRTGATTRPVVEGNECHANGMAGIGVEQEARPTLAGNRCYRNLAAGIGAQSGAIPTILRNECFENAEAGIGLMSGRETLVEGNHCHHNQKAGIGFAGGKTAGRWSALVRSNRFVENRAVAAGINPGWSVRFVGNVFERTEGRAPLVMVFKGSQATLVGNRLRGNGVAGIRVAGEADLLENDVSGPALRKVGPPQHGVWALPGAKVSLSGNRFANLRHALFATEATVVATGNTVSNCVGIAFRLKHPATPPRVAENTLIGDGIREFVIE